MTRTLYIDKNEPKNKHDEFRQFGFEISETVLEVGDYYFNHDNGQLLVERKTIADFDRSVQIDHMFDQANDMIDWLKDEDTTDRRYGLIIIVGDLEYNNQHSNMTMWQRMGAIGSLLIRGCPVLTVPLVKTDDKILSDEYLFNYVVNKMSRSIVEGKMGQFRTVDLFKYKNADMNNLTTAEKVLRLVPGVSKKRAKDIVNAVPDIRFRIDNFGREAYKEIDGVGPKTADNIFELFGGDK